MQLLPDGRANLSVFPVARCALGKLWREPVPDCPGAPQLTFADVEELPVAHEERALVTEDDADDDGLDGLEGADDDSDASESDDEHDGTLRLSPGHRQLLELLVHNPDAMEELGLTHDRVLELLRVVGAAQAGAAPPQVAADDDAAAAAADAADAADGGDDHLDV